VDTLLLSITKRTSLNLTDDRQRKLDRASEIVADGPHDDPPMNVVIDAMLTNLLDHEGNLDTARKEINQGTYSRSILQRSVFSTVLVLRASTDNRCRSMTVIVEDSIDY